MSKAAKQPKEFPGQHPGENVVMVFRQHPVVMRKPLLFGLLALALSILPLDFIFSGPLYPTLTKIPLVVLLIVALVWFYRWVGWHYSVSIITDQRVINIRQKGFFNREVSEVGFDKIQSINYHIKGMQGALLKFGNITIQTYASSWVLESVHHPEEVHSQLMRVAHTVASTPPQN